MNIYKLRLHLFLFFPNAVSTHFHFEKLQFPFHLSNQDDFKQFHTAPNCFNPPSVSYSEKKISTLYTQMTQGNKADPQLTKMILFDIFQIFQINKINFQQYLILHNHPDTFIHKCDATSQTEYTTIRPKAFSKNLSNRTRTSLEKAKLVSYWPSDDNDSTDDEFQKDPLKRHSTKILHIKHLRTSHSEVRRRSQQHSLLAHHQLFGPIDRRPSTPMKLQLQQKSNIILH